jgi:hypothetical protein
MLWMLLACTDPPCNCLEDTSDSNVDTGEEGDTSDTADTAEDDVVGLTFLDQAGAPVDVFTALLTDIDVARHADETGRVEYPVGPGWLEVRAPESDLVNIDLVFGVLVAGEYTVTMKPPADCDLLFEGEDVVCVELDALPGAPEGRIFALGHPGFGTGVSVTSEAAVLTPGIDAWLEQAPQGGMVTLSGPTTVVLPL